MASYSDIYHCSSTPGLKKNIMKDPSLGTYAPRKFNPQGMADMGQVEVAVIGSNWCDLQ